MQKSAEQKTAEQKTADRKSAEQRSAGQRPAGQEAASQASGQQEAPWTAKRIAAVIGIVLLVALYVMTFVSSLIGTEGAGRLFRFSLGMTIAVPIFLWIFIWCVGRFRNKRNMASLDILSSNTEERKKMEKAVHEEIEREKMERQKGGSGKRTD